MMGEVGSLEQRAHRRSALRAGARFLREVARLRPGSL
jgi:hypothetical protein